MPSISLAPAPGPGLPGEHGGDEGGHRVIQPDVVTGRLGEVPAVVEHLVIELGRLEPAAQAAGHRRHRPLEDLGEPAAGDRGLRDAGGARAIQVSAVAGEVVKEAPGLVLLDREPGQRAQGPDVIAGIHHPRIEPQAVAPLLGQHLDLLDRESEGVELADPLLHPVTLVGREAHLLGELPPEAAITSLHLLGGRQRVEAVVDPLRGEVEQLAGQVLAGHHEVMGSLPIAELGVELAGLGVDDVGGEISRIQAEEGVGERAVTPEEAHDVQAHQQVDQGVQQPVCRSPQLRAGLQRPAVGKREFEVPGDQNRLQLGAGPAGATRPAPMPTAGDEGGDLHDRDQQTVELGEQPVLALRQPGGELLQRVGRLPVADEPDHVTGYSPGDVDQALVPPARERELPRQVEEVGVTDPADHLEGRAPTARPAHGLGLRVDGPQRMMARNPLRVPGHRVEDVSVPAPLWPVIASCPRSRRCWRRWCWRRSSSCRSRGRPPSSPGGRRG